MPSTSRIWLEVAHHASFRIGGWAFVRQDGDEIRGSAGGARRIDRERAILMALAAASSDAPRGVEVELLTSDADVLALAVRARSGEIGDAPEADLDVWAQAATALGRLRLEARHTERLSGGPSAFAAAWAELARDRAKTQGPFSAVIPRSNLAKAGL